MYCGDETGSFVGDIGSHLSRFGYGGEDTPKYVVPSYVGTAGADGMTKTPIIPMSCYRLRDELRAPLSMPTVACTSNMEETGTSSDRTESWDVDPVHYLQQGDQIADWDAWEQLWQSAFDVLRVRDPRKHTHGGSAGLTISSGTTSCHSTNTNQARRIAAPGGVVSTTIVPSTTLPESPLCVHPLLLVAPGCTYRVDTTNNRHGDDPCSAIHRKEMAKCTEIMMEAMHCQALFIAPTPMLAAFSMGRQTALVVDMGAGGCRVTPVVDGLLLKQAQRRNGRGGDWLGNVQWKAWASQWEEGEAGRKLKPRYQVLSSNGRRGNGIFHRWAMQDLMYEFRTSEHVRLSPVPNGSSIPFHDPQASSGANAMDVDGGIMPSYELPDGTHIDLSSPLGKDLCRIPELLFTDQVPYFADVPGSGSTLLEQHPTLSNLPLHKLIHSSLTAVADVDARRELASSILLCGAGSLIPNLEQRLAASLVQVIPGTIKTKVLASRHPIERSCAAWIGGSILSSLGSFQQLWLSRSEYEEYGATLAVQRFP